MGLIVMLSLLPNLFLSSLLIIADSIRRISWHIQPAQRMGSGYSTVHIIIYIQHFHVYSRQSAYKAEPISNKSSFQLNTSQSRLLLLFIAPISPLSGIPPSIILSVVCHHRTTAEPTRNVVHVGNGSSKMAKQMEELSLLFNK